MLASHARLRHWAAHNQLLRRRGRNQSSHFANHRQHQPLVAIGKRGAVLFDLRQEANFVLRELAERFLRFAVAWGFRARKKIRQRNVHGFRDFGERFERGDGVSIFDAREVTAQQSGAALDVALRQATLAPIALDHCSDVYPRLFFWHVLSTRGGSLLTNSRSGKGDFLPDGSNPITGEETAVRTPMQEARIRKRRAEARLFLNVPRLDCASAGVTSTFALALPLPVAADGIPAASRSAPLPAGLSSIPERPRRPLSLRPRRSPRPCRRRQSHR